MTLLSLCRTSAFATALTLIAGAAAAQACPEWQQGGQQIQTDAEAAWVPQSYGTTGGGPVNLSACPSVQGVGYVTASPTFTLSYDARNMGRDLDFRVDAQGCDTTILVNDSTAQWHFNDDSDGTLNGRVRLAGAASGRYDIWVGTYGPQTCPVNLIVETFPPATAGGGTTGGTGGQAAAQCPEWSLGGAEWRLAAGQTDNRTVVAGGAVNLFNAAQGCGIQGHGYVHPSPDFTLYYDAPQANADLVISVEGQCDTLLLVNDLNAQWLFNDDTNALHPQITIPAAASGRYDVWVGTYGSELCQSSISLASNLPAPVPTPTPQPTK